MKDESQYFITLEGKVNISKQEISQDIAAKIIRLIVPLPTDISSGGDAGQSHQSSSAIPEPANSLTAKQFMAQKQPKSDMERIASLAYYLTHNKNTQTFKTIDLTHLNSEAAQPRFSNAASAVSNATLQQYLAPAGGGKKQITVRGEALVAALPNRTAVQDALNQNRIRGNKHKSSKKKAKQ